MDYLGDIVAGGEVEMYSDKKIPKTEQWFQRNERDVSCWHLSMEDMRRIPEFEIRCACEVIKE